MVDPEEAAKLLVGKLFTTKHLNRVGVRAAIFKSWNSVPELVISESDNDTFIFLFFIAYCRDKIMNQGPWNIKGTMLILKLWEVDITISELSFYETYLWVQIHGLSLGNSLGQWHGRQELKQAI